MSRPAIVVDSLSKSYQIGRKADAHASFRDAIVGAVTSPFRKLKRLGGEAPSDETFWALKDVSFEVQPGEVVGVIGRNGAGKSTLLKILSRITEPTSGEVRLRGRVASLLEVGTGFHPELSGRENIYLNGAILGMKRAEINRKFDEIVAFAEVEKFLDTPVKRYSSGMYVRLAFSVAAHLEPEILIVDEVLAVGDVEFQRKCLGKMKDIAGGCGRTVLFVSHNMNAVRSLCNRGVLLVGGQVDQIGPVEDVVERYTALSRTSRNAHYIAPGLGEIQSGTCLLRAEILDAQGSPSEDINFGEPFGLRMKWKNTQKIPALAFSWRVFNENDSLILASNTIGSENLSIEGEGEKEVIARCDQNILPPGYYRVEIGGWIRPHTCLQVIEDCLTLVVTDVPYDPRWSFNIVGKPAAAPRIRWETSRTIAYETVDGNAAEGKAFTIGERQNASRFKKIERD